MNVHYASVGNQAVEPRPLLPYGLEDGHLRVIVLHVTLMEKRRVTLGVQLCRELFSFLDATPGYCDIVSSGVETLREVATDAVL